LGFAGRKSGIFRGRVHTGELTPRGQNRDWRKRQKKQGYNTDFHSDAPQYENQHQTQAADED
jgi:hypothetical protein